MNGRMNERERERCVLESQVNGFLISVCYVTFLEPFSLVV